ncbi:Carboxymethylenebutenolidase [Ceratobasidium theobromae]|uniref:Carboxymethylenebutenolidase n=1 Tax=Ceratobasidium theobromae TaxID=1582974 RepID=A0A5N5QBZ1_9AGAM|nr:Carboxymethylenebutenolidase [Ceratobasidium theobromae]
MSTKYTYQASLTYRMHGPGLILVLSNSDTYPEKHTSSGTLHLDPSPSQKWAEEGFCVMSITIYDGTDSSNDVGLDWSKTLSSCVVELEQKPEVEAGNSFGLIIYETKVAREILPCVSTIPKLCCAVVYVYVEHAFSMDAGDSYSTPILQHTYSLGSTDGDPTPSQPSVQEAEDRSVIPSNTNHSIITYRYLLSHPAPGVSTLGTETRTIAPIRPFVHPSSPNYNHTYSTLAHTRTLTFLREQIGGPTFNIEAIWEAHTRFEFEGRDVEGTMGTMVAEPYVNHIPTLTGGIGRKALTSFYAHHFIHSNPDSTRLELVSRTIGPDRVVDEFIFEFVHDREIDWMLPGVPPTGKHVRVPFVAVVNIRGDKLYHEHIYWDQASVLVQIGLLPERLAFPGTANIIKLPVAGSEQADKMLDPGARESNLLINKRAR